MKHLLIILFFFITTEPICFGQKGNFKLGLRLPVQYEGQKAVIPFSWGNEIQNVGAVNFGLDALPTFKTNKFSIYAGAGFFRQRYNIKRGYNHQAFSGDSLPIGIKTQHYTYSLFRLPQGIQFTIFTIKKTTVGVGAEHIYNFSFRRRYEAAKTNVYNGFGYLGNSVNVMLTLNKELLNKHLVQIEPYVRIYNKYKKDQFFWEDENASVKRNFDAFGVGFKYMSLSKN